MVVVLAPSVKTFPPVLPFFKNSAPCFRKVGSRKSFANVSSLSIKRITSGILRSLSNVCFSAISLKTLASTPVLMWTVDKPVDKYSQNFGNQTWFWYLHVLCSVTRSPGKCFSLKISCSSKTASLSPACARLNRSCHFYFCCSMLDKIRRPWMCIPTYTHIHTCIAGFGSAAILAMVSAVLVGSYESIYERIQTIIVYVAFAVSAAKADD